MKKFLIILATSLSLAGCSNEEPDPKMELLVKENKLLHEKLEERPPLSAHELRETMNLSMKAMNAMVQKDFQYLESIADSTVIINKETGSFQFENGDHQDFLQSIDYSKLEYCAHIFQDDIITVTFAQPPAEYYFEFTIKEDKLLLRSFLTN